MCFAFLLDMWCFSWQSMQTAILISAKSLINNDYTIKVLMKGLKFWNAVSVGLDIVLLNYFYCIKSIICSEFALKCTCSLSSRTVSNSLKYQTFLVYPDLDSCIIILRNMEVIFIHILQGLLIYYLQRLKRSQKKPED